MEDSAVAREPSIAQASKLASTLATFAILSNPLFDLVQFCGLLKNRDA
jgi:hypothetical protein